MKHQLTIQRPSQPAPACAGCQHPHQTHQDRVVHSQNVSLFANATPLVNPPYGTEEIRLQDSWFYLSLHVPLHAVLNVLENNQLPWLCPKCAGFSGHANSKAPGATVLTDSGQQRATGAYSLFDKVRHEQYAAPTRTTLAI